MSRNRSVAKGNRNERVLAEILSRWSNYPLRKTPRDGDWAKAMYPGDIIPTVALKRDEWPFSFEAKDVEEFNLDSSLRGRKTAFTEFLDHALDRRATHFPILVAKRNRTRHVVFTPALPDDRAKMLFFHRLWWHVIPLDEFVEIPYEEMRNVAWSAIRNGDRIQVGNSAG